MPADLLQHEPGNAPNTISIQSPREPYDTPVLTRRGDVVELTEDVDAGGEDGPQGASNL
jgi:hypothetical protein